MIRYIARLVFYFMDFWFQESVGASKTFWRNNWIKISLLPLAAFFCLLISFGQTVS
jgi:hypothetical protein